MNYPNTGSRPRYQKTTPTQFFLTFGYAWLTIGLFSGTLILVVAVGGILKLLQRFGWGQRAQDRVLIAVIIVFVVGTFMLARLLVRRLYRFRPRTRRIVLVALALPAVLSGYAWSNPARFLAGFAGSEGSTLALAGGPTFLFGAYPDEGALRKLKASGVTTVVSLQSPSVLVEISGINDERKATSALGMTFVEAPMLPWVSDNTESLEKIKKLALTGHGTYYIHCGLGRDRVNIVRRVIESLQPKATVAAANDLKDAVGFERRTEPFERGMPMKLGDGAWVVPFLNDAEFYGFIVQGQPGQVILALDPRDTAQRRWIAQADSEMKQYAVKHELVSYPAANGDTSTAAIVARVKALHPPFTVIVPHMTESVGDPKDPVARAIGKAFGTSVKALPKRVQLTKGETPDLVAPPVPPPSRP